MVVVVKVKIIGPREEVKEVDVDKVTVGELLRKLGLLSSEYIVIKNNIVIVEDELIRDGDEIIVYPVKSGG
ncbi:MAG: hypothetical protein B6U89_01995 [Desulfurococcales archaeon ex4484_58]|nr:MAG: hypothetical protein B6U89_01995 [Desulfurococcales archaeon ex4484_58]